MAPVPRAVGFAALTVAGVVVSFASQPVICTLPATPAEVEKFSPPISVAPPASLTCRDVVSVSLPVVVTLTAAGENASAVGTPQVETAALFGPATVTARE